MKFTLYKIKLFLFIIFNNLHLNLMLFKKVGTLSAIVQSTQHHWDLVNNTCL